MPNLKALVASSGKASQIVNTDTLVVGSGIDTAVAGALSIGTTTANGITVGASGIITTFPGRVGVGTASPSGILEAAGGTAAASTNGTPITLTAQAGGSGNTNGGNVVINAGNASGTGASGSIFLNAGGLGSSASAGGVYAKPGINNTTAFAVLNAASAGIFTVDTLNNRVGVNTITPTGTLQVSGGTAAASTGGTPITLTAQNGGSGNANGGNIVLNAGASTGTGTAGAIIARNATDSATAYMFQRLATDTGTATGTQSTTTLQDTSKVWLVNQYVGATVTLTSGTGVGQARQVVSNTADTLTVNPAWTTTPVSASTGYSVSGSTLLNVDTANQRVSVGGVAGTHTFNVGTGSSANFCVASGGRIHTYDGTAPTNGQVLIGDTALGNFAKATLTAGSGVSITNGAGSITISATGSGGTVTSVSGSGGTTGLTLTGGPITTTGTLTLGGTLIAANGGTGFSSYAVGDLLFANTTTTLAKLADVATGNALISGGVGVAPSWGKIGLTTHVSGTLSVSNGGTGNTTFAANGVLLGNGTGAVSSLTGALPSNVLRSQGIGVAPAWGKVLLANDVSGTLPVANGGTGITTTPTNGQIPIGNGTTYTAAALTAGTGIAITNGSGSITIAASNAAGVQPITTISTTTTLDGTNYTVLCSATLTVNLPAAASNTGRVYNIKNIGAAATITVDPNASETIDGATTYTLTTQYESITIQCDGTAWFIL